MEIPRTSASLGVTIVGGSDTPLRCVVVQEVFPDGLVASDGRLQPGDQIIEINGVDMTCATHTQVERHHHWSVCPYKSHSQPVSD